MSAIRKLTGEVLADLLDCAFGSRELRGEPQDFTDCWIDDDIDFEAAAERINEFFNKPED